MDVAITIISALVPLIGVTTTLLITLKKHKREKELREEEKTINFYTNTAINLVMSAERLELTGPEKKNYVMIWLENEALRAGIKVDYPLMSLTIEKAIILMNDHRNLDKPIPDLIKESVKDHVDKEREQILIDEMRALGKMNKAIEITDKGIRDAERYLKNQEKKV